MATKPTDLPRWATDPGATVEPLEADKDTGYIDAQEPAANEFNWLLNTIYNWCVYLDEFLDTENTFSIRQNFESSAADEAIYAYNTSTGDAILADAQGAGTAVDAESGTGDGIRATTGGNSTKAAIRATSGGTANALILEQGNAGSALKATLSVASTKALDLATATGHAGNFVSIAKTHGSGHGIALSFDGDGATDAGINVSDTGSGRAVNIEGGENSTLLRLKPTAAGTQSPPLVIEECAAPADIVPNSVYTDSTSGAILYCGRDTKYWPLNTALAWGQIVVAADGTTVTGAGFNMSVSYKPSSGNIIRVTFTNAVQALSSCMTVHTRATNTTTVPAIEWKLVDLQTTHADFVAHDLSSLGNVVASISVYGVQTKFDFALTGYTS